MISRERIVYLCASLKIKVLSLLLYLESSSVPAGKHISTRTTEVTSQANRAGMFFLSWSMNPAFKTWPGFGGQLQT